MLPTAWLERLTSHQHFAIAVRGLAWVLGILCQAMLIGIYGLVSHFVWSPSIFHLMPADVGLRLVMAASTHSLMENHGSIEPRSLARAAPPFGVSCR